MSRVVGSELPPDLMARLSGRDLQPVASKVIQIVTIDEGGWPHAALLSYFEVVAADRRRVRLASYANSTTSANMRRNGKATLIVIDGFGLAQHEGGPIEEIRPGDVVSFLPGEKHWHGASPTTAMTHFAIQESLDGKAVEWMEKVTDEQYERYRAS